MQRGLYNGDVTIDEALDFMSSNPDSVLVDVRTPAEWQETGIAKMGDVILSSVLMEPKMEFNPLFIAETIPQIENAKEIFFICRSGKRSDIAAQMIAEHTGKTTYNVSGGMLEWKRLKLPTTPHK